MDLDTGMRSSDCPYTVHFYGAMFREGEVMICMEVMDISLDKFYMRAFARRDLPEGQRPIPEPILGKIAYSVRNSISTPPVYISNLHPLIFVGGDGTRLSLPPPCDPSGCETIQYSDQPWRSGQNV